MEPLIDEKGKVSKSKRSRVRCCSMIDWWQEIWSFLFSVLCLLGMVILLSRIQNRPLTSWSFVVSPNALISVLSTASKACLILPVSECISQLKWMHLVESKRENRLTNLQDFDNASRGPLGSFRFLFHTPTRAWLPYLGCAITLVAVATDAFVQQILGFETELVLASKVYSELRTAQDVYEWDGDASFEMQKSVNLALYGEPQLPDLHCPGSICDYPSFASIGATSKCQDVTTRSSRDCIMGEPQRDFQEQWCNFTSPGGFQLQSNQMHIYDSTLRGMQGTSSTTKNSIYTEVPYPDVLLDFGVLQYPYDFIEPTGSVQIHECTLKMSAVDVRSGIPISQILQHKRFKPAISYADSQRQLGSVGFGRFSQPQRPGDPGERLGRHNSQDARRTQLDRDPRPRLKLRGLDQSALGLDILACRLGARRGSTPPRRHVPNPPRAAAGLEVFVDAIAAGARVLPGAKPRAEAAWDSAVPESEDGRDSESSYQVRQSGGGLRYGGI
ncbi:hypothetical protein PG985_007595 [Apiospora marii]|uniref:Uncharacterized protein n=1 Tax=Apiospora marii TaxID=335849 RepID=A0ABR1SN32_9PEZI